MMKNRTPEPAAEEAIPSLALETVEKGSHRSMWELLLQLRALLPYLVRLVPLLDHALTKAAPGIDVKELHRGMAAIQTGSRELEVQVKNQAVQMERMEQQLARLRTVHESSMEETRVLVAEIRSFRRWTIALAVVIVVLLVVSVGMVSFLVMNP